VVVAELVDQRPAGRAIAGGAPDSSVEGDARARVELMVVGPYVDGRKGPVAADPEQGGTDRRRGPQPIGSGGVCRLRRANSAWSRGRSAASQQVRKFAT
jgi:hypothetical protein